MGIFSTSSPFDSDVEKATDEKNTSEEWGLIMDICDKVGTSTINAKDCLRSIMKRLNHQDPHIVMQAITLLDACVNNCGKNFHLEIASRDFETEFRKLLHRSQLRVSEKLRQLLKKWAEGDFKSDPQLSLIPSLYSKLRQEGIDFTPHTDVPRQTAPISKDPNVVSSQQEEDDIAKAIDLSLKETTSSPKVQVGLYPSTSLVHPQPEPRKVRALYDFEAAEDNELTFSAGEMIHVLDDSDPNWWKGYNYRGEGLFPANFVTADLSEQVKVEQPRKSVQFSEAVQVKTLAPEEVEIDEQKVDRLLHLLHEADPADDRSDTTEMLRLEDTVNAMGPLIDQELERVDRKHAQLTHLSSDLVEALNLYHMLMREPANTRSYQTLPPKQPVYGYSPQQPQQQQTFNGGLPSTSSPYSVPQYSIPPDRYTMQGGMTLPPNFQMGPGGPPSHQSLPEDHRGQQPMSYPLGALPNYGPPSMQGGLPPAPFPPPGPQQGPPPPGGNYPPSGQPLL